MLPYASISSVLDEISKAKRRDKASLAAHFLADIPPRMLCPCCRLLIGELWPPWVQEEAGIGPATIAQSLAEISNANVQELMGQLGEMGAVAEAAVRQSLNIPYLASLWRPARYTEALFAFPCKKASIRNIEKALSCEDFSCRRSPSRPSI